MAAWQQAQWQQQWQQAQATQQPLQQAQVPQQQQWQQAQAAQQPLQQAQVAATAAGAGWQQARPQAVQPAVQSAGWQQAGAGAFQQASPQGAGGCGQISTPQWGANAGQGGGTQQWGANAGQGGGMKGGMQGMQRPGGMQGMPGAVGASNSWGGATLQQRQQQLQQAAGGTVVSYVVHTTGNDSEEVVVRTLVGEYKEVGSNHQRKYFQKVAINPGPDFVDVFLYYWDSRDGPAFEGWWFGNKLGGTQVWSHNDDKGMQPPGSNWKIPWDGQIRPTIVVQSKADRERQQFEQKFAPVTKLVTEAHENANKAVQEAKTVAGDYTSLQSLLGAEQLLVPHTSSLTEAQKKLSEAQRSVTPGEGQKFFMGLGNQIRTTTQQLATELNKVRTSKTKAEIAQKARLADERDQNAWKEVSAELIEKNNSAEDAVEKAVITAEMITAAGENMDEVRQAVEQTEVATKTAQAALGEARILMNSKMVKARSFESERVKTEALAEMQKLTQQLQAAQAKLNPLKTARSDFLNKQAAQQMVTEVLERLSPAEIEVDKAEETGAPLSEEGVTKDAMQACEMAIKKAETSLNAALRFMETKERGANAIAQKEVAKLKERWKTSETKLTALKNKHKDSSERVACELLMKEASEKLTTVQESVSKAADAEGPFLMGVEELPMEETMCAVKACETAATAANTAVSIARMFIATKIVEAKRFAAQPAQEASAKLKDFQKSLEVHTKRLTDLKTATANRKRTALMREAEHQVAQAESHAKAMATAASVFEDDAKLAELPAEALKSAAEETQKAEAAAGPALTECRKYLTARQIEAKGKDASPEVTAELGKLQGRLSVAQQEVQKWKRLASTVEQRLAAKRTIEEATTRVKGVEEQVEKAVTMVGELDKVKKEEEGEAKEEVKEEKPDGAVKEEEKEGEQDKSKTKEPVKSEDDVKAVETAAAEAQGSIKNVERWLNTQLRSQGLLAKDEISKLLPRLKAAQEKLDSIAASLRARAEKIVVKGIIAESETRVKDAEEAVKKAGGAEAPFMKKEGEEGEAELKAEQAATALEELEAATAAAHTAVGGTKTFIAMKRLAAKRLSEDSTKAANEELNTLQGRLDAAAKKLGEIKKSVAERRHAIVRREMAAKIEEVTKLVQAAKEATTSLTVEGDQKPDDMKASCEKAGKAQAQAITSLDVTRKALQARQRDVKGVDAGIVGDLTKMLDQLQALQIELDAMKATVREQEHKFVAQRLLKDAVDMVEALEKKLKDTEAVAAPLNDHEDFQAAIFLSQIVEALKTHMKEKNKTSEGMFAEISGSEEKIPEAKFISFLSTMPELSEEKDSLFSEAELITTFKRLGQGNSEVTKEQFAAQFQHKYVVTGKVSMTDSLTVKGGKTVRKLDINEVLEALAEPTKDPNLNLLRVKAKAEKDGKEGFITIAGNQGTVYLQDYSPWTACEKRVERAVQELADTVHTTARYVDQKAEELRSVKSGPLADTKAELVKLKPRVGKVQQEQVGLRGKMGEAQRKYAELLEGEQKRRQEAVDRRAAKAMTDAANEQANALQEQVDKTVPAAETLVKTRGADLDAPLAAMDQAEKDLEATMAAIEKAKDSLGQNMEKIKSSTRGPFSDARSIFVKLKVKLGEFERKCQKQTAALKAAHKQVANDAYAAITSALRAHADKEGIRPEDLFAKLSKEGKAIPVAEMGEFLQKLPDSQLKAAQIDLGLQRYASVGVPKFSLLGMLQTWMTCVKEIAITNVLIVKDSKAIKKLAIGEVVEVLGPPQSEEGSSISRVLVRTVEDQKEGWATVKGNQGTVYLDTCAKPYHRCDEEVLVQSAFGSMSSEVRRMQPGEVLEVLEGPRKEDALEIVRARGRAARDNKVGWVTFKDAEGKPNFEAVKLLVCRTTIAITPSFDIGEGKPVRKLEVGELMEVVEEAKQDEKKKLQRVKVKTKRDEKEGWVTVKGNQGSLYVEETDKLMMCKQSMGLETRFETGSPSLRLLEAGEIFEVQEGPQTESKEGANRVRGRNLSDGKEGWFSIAVSGGLVPWTSRYVCSSSTALSSGLDPKSGDVRRLEQGELLVALDTPVFDTASGLVRVSVRADSDGACGLATVQGRGGPVYLAPAEEPVEK